MSTTYAFSFFSNPSPHWHPVKTYKPNLFFPKIFWISLIFWLNPPISPSKFSEIADRLKKYIFSVCMQNTKIYFFSPILSPLLETTRQCFPEAGNSRQKHCNKIIRFYYANCTIYSHLKHLT